MKKVNSPQQPVSILLIEDNEDDVLIARHAFRSVDIDVNLLVACDGEEALLLLRREPPFQQAPRPQIIFLDLNMPRMDGREMLSLVKSDEDLRAIPVVVLTTSDADIDIAAAYESHANAFITKPLDFKQFREIIVQTADYWLKAVALPPMTTSI